MIEWHSNLSIPLASDMTTAHALGSGPASCRPHRITTDVSGDARIRPVERLVSVKYPLHICAV